MSEKQSNFLKKLVDQLGYEDSEYKEYFLSRIGFDKADIAYASKLIDGLIKENKKRKFARRKYVNNKNSVTVKDLSQFVFCPASYSVKKSFTIDYEIHEDNHTVDTDEDSESYLLQTLNTMKEFDLNTEDKFSKYFYDFGHLLDNNLVYDGFSETSRYGHNKAYDIKGKPHLILESSSGRRTLVLEKTTYSDSFPENVRENHRVQALAYNYLFKEFICSEIVIIYWRQYTYKKYVLDREYRLFKIETSESNEKNLMNSLHNYGVLRSGLAIVFDVNTINPKKCFKCSCRAICDHKSGLIDKLTLPYENPNYDAKYPVVLNYWINKN